MLLKKMMYVHPLWDAKSTPVGVQLRDVTGFILAVYQGNAPFTWLQQVDKDHTLCHTHAEFRAGIPIVQD